MQNKLLFFFALCALMLGFSAIPASAKSKAEQALTTAEANKALILKWAKSLNDNDMDYLQVVLHKDFVDHNAFPGVPPTKEGYISTLKKAHAEWFPDIQVRVDQILAEGDWVSFRVHVTATHTGNVMGAAPTGNQLVWDAMGFYRVRDGQLIERRELLDSAAFMTQLGLLKPAN